MKNKNRVLCVSDVIYIALVCLLIYIKSYSFYSHVSLASFPPLFAAMTSGIFLTLFSLVSLVSPKAARTITMVIYSVMSVFMAVDAVYYSYASKMPSAALLSLAWQIGKISDTVEHLVKLRHVMLIFDLPFWLIYRINRAYLRRHFEQLYEKLSQKVSVKAYYIPACILMCAVLVMPFVYPEFEARYMVNELFCYHTKDFYTTLSNATVDYTVDKTKYASPDYSDSEYYGVAEGRNVFIIQVEALQNFVIGTSYEGQEIMPNLNAMIANDTIYFNNYSYQIGGGNTSDAEFAVNNSLFAPESEAAYVKYENNDFYGLPFLLKNSGYTGAHAFHGYEGSFWNRRKAYVKQGFDDFTALEDFEQTDMFPMGLSDKEMFRQSLEKIKTYEEPFYSFIITVSSHYPYGIPLKDRDITVKESDNGTLFGCYVQAVNYTDRAIGEFIEGLKECGLYENSIIVIYGDHYALSNTDSNNTTRFKDTFGRDYNIFDVFNIPLIIHIPGSGITETKTIAGGHMDVLPTLLCLLGIHNDKAVMFGQNLLEAESGFVCEQTHLAIGSFISDEVFFSKPHNNIKSNYDAYERGTMARLDPDLFTEQSEEAARRIEDCKVLLTENDIMLD